MRESYPPARERAPQVRPPTRAEANRGFELGEELGGPVPAAPITGGLLAGAEEARRFADFVRRRRQAPSPTP